jgi:hypothetical protein
MCGVEAGSEEGVVFMGVASRRLPVGGTPHCPVTSPDQNGGGPS